MWPMLDSVLHSKQLSPSSCCNSCKRQSFLSFVQWNPLFHSDKVHPSRGGNHHSGAWPGHWAILGFLGQFVGYIPVGDEPLGEQCPIGWWEAFSNTSLLSACSCKGPHGASWQRLFTLFNYLASGLQILLNTSRLVCGNPKL